MVVLMFLAFILVLPGISYTLWQQRKIAMALTTTERGLRGLTWAGLLLAAITLLAAMVSTSSS